MRRIRVAVITALIAIVVVLLLEHPEILTGGASAMWSSGSILGDHLVMSSYAIDILETLTMALAIVATFLGIRRRLKQRSAWKRRYSMKSIKGGKPPNPENEPGE
jgi:preprotein translocase subunit SecG